MQSDAGLFNLEVGVFPLQRLVFASQTHFAPAPWGLIEPPS